MERALSGILLAGGASTRMGTDKALLAVGGLALATRVARLLAEACDEVIVASGDGERLGWLGLLQVADSVPSAGPLAGIVAGLERARHPLAAVVAIDMPFASPALLRLLAARWGGEDAVVPVTGRGPEPLHAVYATAAAPALRRRLAGPDRSLRGALAALRVRTVGRDEWAAVDPDEAFAVNLNRPEDLTASACPPRRPDPRGRGPRQP